MTDVKHILNLISGNIQKVIRLSSRLKVLITEWTKSSVISVSLPGSSDDRCQSCRGNFH